jgi:hypothetical protein
MIRFYVVEASQCQWGNINAKLLVVRLVLVTSVNLLITTSSSIQRNFGTMELTTGV